MQLPNGSSWPWDGRRKKSKTEDHTAQVGPGDRGRKKSKKRNGFDFDFDLIWIEIGVFKNKKNSRNELARPAMGIICLVNIDLCHRKNMRSRCHVWGRIAHAIFWC